MMKLGFLKEAWQYSNSIYGDAQINEYFVNWIVFHGKYNSDKSMEDLMTEWRAKLA